jgi:hypothetical protein
MGYRNYSTAVSHIVDINGQGDFTTIGAALAVATSGQTIFIRPGTYTENPTLKAGVNLCAFEPFAPVFTSTTIPNVIINGICTFTAAGTVGMSGICLQTNSNFALAVTGSAASVVNLNNCFIFALNNTAISFTSTSSLSEINMSYCGGDTGTTGIALFANSGNGYFSTNFCYFENSGATLTANTLSGTASEWFMRYTTIRNGVIFSGTSTFQMVHSEFLMVGNQIALTNNSTGIGGGAYHCFFSGNTSSAVSIGAGAAVSLHYVFLSSSSANTVAGTGTLTFSSLTGNSGFNLSAGLTLSNANATTFNSALGVGTSGQVWTSRGASLPPTFQTAGGGKLIQWVRNTSTTATSTATNLAITTTPTTVNTVLLISATITPTNSSNILVFEFSCPLSSSAASTVGFFLFNGTTFVNAFPFDIAAAADAQTATFSYYVAAGTTSAITFNIYYAGRTGTAFLLTNSASTALYGGTGNTSITFTVSEITP